MLAAMTMNGLRLTVVLLGAGCSGTLGALDDGDAGGSGAGGGSTGGGSGGGGGTNVVVDAGTPIEPGNPGTGDVTFTIRSDANVHAISPLIYGTNAATDPSLNKFALVRLGGNRLTAFNWENNASNAGSDYMFQNDGYLSTSNTPGDAVTKLFATVKALGGAALVTVPILDYVAADKAPAGNVANSGSTYLSTRFKQNRAEKGGTLSMTPDTSDAYVNQDEFVSWVKNTASVPVIFCLDNEPDLWSSSHSEIYKTKLSYDELVTRNLSYARMIKKVWPGAEVTGFVSYGWQGFVNLQDAPDAAAKGDFLNYYLKQIKAAQVADGHRVVDFLDLHWYPEAKGGGTRIIGTSNTDAIVAARVQAPRSLWDSTYRETSWISDFLGAPISLLPRLRAKVEANAPGTKLAFTEWNYGGANHVSGTIAVADVLGVFGRDSVELATYWPLNGAEPWPNLGFRLYRNFDGAGSAVGDTSISATASKNDLAAVYASIDSSDVNRVVIVAINRATSVTRAAMTIAHPQTFSKLNVYTVTARGGSQINAAPDVMAVSTNAFMYSMPALSVSVLVPRHSP